jgi:paraquat-inducible protein A
MVFLISFLLLLAPITFTLGIILPLVRFETFYFFDDTPSLLGIITTLFDGGDYLLAILVAGFSVVFPFIKQLAVTLEAVNHAPSQSEDLSEQGFLSKLVPVLSKWSMMDVLLVAIVIVAAKSSGVASAFSQPGLWFYASSALITIIAHQLIKYRLK